ncbi:MAG: hypothetical protein JK586_12390 [Nocardiopsis sp. BM-2018]|nr:MAG: hypothetical protein JK586_12390 [Nocardiopsis sp. BM-2018]
MTSRTLSPVMRVLALTAALSLFLSGCGLVNGSSGEEETTAASAESPAEEEAPQEEETEEESGEEASDTPSLADPGILTANCGVREGWVEYTLYSDTAERILHARFDILGVDRAESPDLSHGRAVDAGIALGTSCHQDAPPLFPERHLVLVTFSEEVNGNDVKGFGVLSEDGVFTALSPEQEVGDFATPINYDHPVADPERDRILFVQDEGGSEHTIHAMDLESGEITDLDGTCARMRCDQLTVVPGIDAAVLYGHHFVGMAVTDDGAGLVGSVDSHLAHYYDLSDQVGADVVDLTRDGINSNRSSDVRVDPTASFQALDDGTLIFDDNVLSVMEFTSQTPAEYEAANEGVIYIEQEPLPADRTLIPEGTRSNSAAFVSHDSSEVLFRSKAPNGDTSWYRVPADGSSEPEEFPGLPADLNAILSWT